MLEWSRNPREVVALIDALARLWLPEPLDRIEQEVLRRDREESPLEHCSWERRQPEK